MSFKVVGIGELLWDLLPSGPQLGGAPANFAFHAHQLGAEAEVISRIGRDALGSQMLERFDAMDVGSQAVQVDAHLPTGTASVTLDAGGTPHFVIQNNVAWDEVGLTDAAFELAHAADAICFGTLAQRTESAALTIQKLVHSTQPAALRVFDVNLRQKFYSQPLLQRSLEIANVVKLNDHELSVLSPMFELTGDTRQKIEQLSGRFELNAVALTCAEKGSLLYRAGDWSDQPGATTEIVDTVGAGDAFTAGLVMGLLHKLNLEELHHIAVEMANFVCSRAGATPELPAHLRVVFASNCTEV